MTFAGNYQGPLYAPHPDIKKMNRDQLQNDYIESIIDGMDHKSMYQYVYDMLEQSLETYSDEELVTEVKDYYPELLEPTISELEATADDYGCGK
jgi:hypothetical protein